MRKALINLYICPAAKILSNKNAKIKIERSNTEVLAKRFINILLNLTPECK